MEGAAVLDSRRGRLALLAAGAGVFMLNLDVTIVAVALPQIQTDLETGTGTLQWVLSAYLLTLAAFVVTLGRFGDEHGRRRVFVGGILLFVVGSVLAGLAPTIEWVIAARVLQGVGAAAVQALSLALIADVFPPSERGRAIGLWSAIASISVAFGPILGGVIVELVGWRWIFFVNLPFGLAIAALAQRALPDRRGSEAEGHDPGGFLTSTLGLGLLLLAIIEGRNWGWDSPLTIVTFAAALALLAAFTAIELWAATPIADLRLFARPRFRGAALGISVSRATYYATFFLVPLGLQEVAGLSPIETGLLMLPMVATILVSSPLAGALSDRVGALPLIGVGTLLNAGGIALLGVVGIDGAPALVIVASIVFAIGSAAIYAPINAVGIGAVPAGEMGAGSGLMAMVRYVSAAAAVAVAVALFQGLADDHASGHIESASHQLRLTAGDVDGVIAGSQSVDAALDKLPADVADEVRAIAQEAAAHGSATTFALIGAAGLLAGLLSWRMLRRAE